MAIIDTHVHVWALDERHQPPPSAVLKRPASAMPVEWLVDEARVWHCPLRAGHQQRLRLGQLIHGRVPGTLSGPVQGDRAGRPAVAGNADDLRGWMRQGCPASASTRSTTPTSRADRSAGARRSVARRGRDRRDHAVPPLATPRRRAGPHDRAPPRRSRHRPSQQAGCRRGVALSQLPAGPASGRLPKVWVKIGDYQIASQQPFPWPDTAPFVAELRRAFGPARMIWGTGYAGGGGRLVPLAQALEYVQRHLPCRRMTST